MVVSNIFYFHPYLGKIPILTNIFQRGWNHQPVFCFSRFSRLLPLVLSWAWLSDENRHDLAAWMTRHFPDPKIFPSAKGRKGLVRSVWHQPAIRLYIDFCLPRYGWIGVGPENGWFIIWKTLLKWMIWGYHYFWKHPYDGLTTVHGVLMIFYVFISKQPTAEPPN